MSLQDQAGEFRHAYDVENTPDNKEMQLKLIVEECSELVYAHNNEMHTDVLKELADLVYVCFQYAENLEWDLDEAMRRIHQSNMSKLGEDGKPIRREDGKVLKGPNYKPPYLGDLCHFTEEN
jgi:NTP pyrophosphatase (non-canonical NTP hydrolase)